MTKLCCNAELCSFQKLNIDLWIMEHVPGGMCSSEMEKKRYN